MLRSPYPSVQRWGYEGLAAYGEAPAGFTPAPPVSFRLLVDGEPLVSSSLGYVVSWTNGDSLSGGVATDADGIATLERDLFVDPKAPVGAVRFSMGLTDDDEGARLEGSLAPPEDLDAVTVVRLEVAGLPRR